MSLSYLCYRFWWFHYFRILIRSAKLYTHTKKKKITRWRTYRNISSSSVARRRVLKTKVNAEGSCVTKNIYIPTRNWILKNIGTTRKLKEKTGKLSTFMWKKKSLLVSLVWWIWKENYFEKIVDKPDQTAFRTSLS